MQARLPVIAATLVALVTLSTATAQEVEVGVGASDDRMQAPGIAVGLGWTLLDAEEHARETFQSMALRSEFSLLGFDVGLKLDVRLEDDNDVTVREEDWDETSDYLRVVDYVRYNGEYFGAEVAPLYDGRLGFGTLLNHYHSYTDFDSPKTGAQAHIDLGFLRLEGITNDVVNDEVIGGRIVVRPFSTGIADLFNPGLTGQIVVDRDAPTTLILDGNGQVMLDEDENIRYNTDPFYAWGVGLELPVIETIVNLTTYAELNFLSGHGRGAHMGAVLSYDFSLLVDITLVAQGEYRIFSDEYISPYFGPLYELERLRYPDLDSVTTKREALNAADSGRGYVAELAAVLPFVKVGGSWQGIETEDEDNLVTVSAETVDFPWFRARATYAKWGVRQPEDTFSFDERTTMTGQVLYPVNSFLWLDLGVTRNFELDETTRIYEPVDSYYAGLQFGFVF